MFMEVRVAGQRTSPSQVLSKVPVSRKAQSQARIVEQAQYRILSEMASSYVHGNDKELLIARTSHR